MKKIFPVALFFCAVILGAAESPVAPPATNAFRPEPRVIAVDTNTLMLGEPVMITVTNLSTLLADARLKSKKVVLFVEGLELKDVTPIGIYVETNTLRFSLNRTAANKDIWTPIIRHPIKPELRPLLLSVGLQGEQPVLVDEAARGAMLRLIGWNAHTYFWMGVFVALLLIFLLFAVYSDMLRDMLRGPKDATGRRPYSLARAQAGFWMFITVISLVFIWVITGDLTTLNASVLTLSTTFMVLSSASRTSTSPGAMAGPTFLGSSCAHAVGLECARMTPAVARASMARQGTGVAGRIMCSPFS